jgi:hypothetical protein
MHRPYMRGQGSEQFFSDTPIVNTSMDGNSLPPSGECFLISKTFEMRGRLQLTVSNSARLI